MNFKRTHVVIPKELVQEIDSLVGSRRRSSFLVQAAERELMRLLQMNALTSSAGSWKDRDHPELKSGSSKWVKKLRPESETRLQKVTPK